MKKMEELSYHVDFGPYYVHLTRKQKRYLAARSVILHKKSVHRMSLSSFYRSAWARGLIASTLSSSER